MSLGISHRSDVASKSHDGFLHLELRKAVFVPVEVITGLAVFGCRLL